MTPRRVVVTGLGIVSAAGRDLDTFWSRLRDGRSTVRGIRRFDASAYPTRVAAEIDEIDFRAESNLPAEWERRGRIGQFAALAVERAVDDARIPPAMARDRIGIVIASGLGTHEHVEVIGPAAAAARSTREDFDWETFAVESRRLIRERAAERRSPGSIPTLLAEQYDLRGPVMSVMTACAGGTQALGDARRWIRAGHADCVIAAGADSEIYPLGLASFCLLGALSRQNDDPPPPAGRSMRGATAS